jgi:hypothetical protein
MIWIYALTNKTFFLRNITISEVSYVQETLNYYQKVLGIDVDFTWKDNDTSSVITHAGVSFGNNNEEEENHLDGIHAHLQLTSSSRPINVIE